MLLSSLSSLRLSESPFPFPGLLGDLDEATEVLMELSAGDTKLERVRNHWFMTQPRFRDVRKLEH